MYVKLLTHNKKALVIAGVLVPVLITAFILFKTSDLLENESALKSPAASFQITDAVNFKLDTKKRNGISFTKEDLPQSSALEQDYPIKVKLIHGTQNREVAINPLVKMINEDEFSIGLQPLTDHVVPGFYTVEVEYQSGRRTKTFTQDFSWGVLAINTNKAIYNPDETAKIDIAVLDHNGDMVCDADVSLIVTDPDNNTTHLSTANGSIKVNAGCSVKAMILEPDFEASYQIDKVGHYAMELTATTENGVSSITDSFEVKTDMPFEIERITATRIYPPESYPVTIKVKANQDYTGVVTEKTHWEFNIPESTEHTSEQLNEDGEGLGEHIITWDVNWKAGQEYTLEYEYKAINRSPDFYLIGPLKIGDYSEGRQWQIASDAAPGGEWWDTNYRFRQKITVTTGSDAIAATHTVRFDMTTDSLITAGKMESDCDDLAVAYWGGSSWTELDRTVFRCDEIDSAIWFNVESAVSSSSTDDNYYVYYDYASATASEDHSNVWRVYDDFDDGDTTGWGYSSGSYGIESVTNPWSGGSYVMQVGYTGSACGTAYVKNTGWSTQNVQVKMLWLDNPSSTCSGGSPDADGIVGVRGQANTSYNGILVEWDTDSGFHYDTGAGGSCGTPTCPIRTFDSWDWTEQHVVGTSYTNHHAKYWADDESEPYTNNLNATSVSATTAGYVFVRAASGYARIAVVMAGDAVINEPTAPLGSEEKLVILSGTAYTNDDESTTLDSLSEVCVAVDGTDNSECVDTDSSGDYIINAVDIFTGDELAIFINHATTHANLLTVSDGEDKSGLDLYQNHIILRADSGPNTSIVGIDAYDNDQNATDMLFDATDSSPDTLTWEAGTELFIPSGHTFVPGGNTNGHDIEIDGIWTAASGETITIDGSFKLDTGGTFTPSTSTLTFDATSGTEDLITDGTGDLYDLVIDDGGGGSLVVEVEDDLVIQRDVTITDGTLDAKDEGNQITVHRHWDNDDSFDGGDSLVLFDGSGATTYLIDSDGPGTLDAFYDVTFNDQAGGATFQLTSELDADHDLTITGGTLDTNSNDIYVGRNWTNDDIFTEDTNTVTLDGGYAANLDSGCSDEDTCTSQNFYNLTINKAEDAKVTLSTTHLRVTNLINVVTGWLIQGALNIRSEGATAVRVDDYGRWENTSTGDVTLGGNVVNDGNITLNSNGMACGDADSISINSTVAAQRSWSGVGGFRIADVTVQYQTGSAVIHTPSSTNSGNMGVNWFFIPCNESRFEGIEFEGVSVN